MKCENVTLTIQLTPQDENTEKLKNVTWMSERRS